MKTLVNEKKLISQLQGVRPYAELHTQLAHLLYKRLYKSGKVDVPLSSQ